ncbi:MAG: 4Fe-4S dicluster domain-containing protein [Clostridiaceae bacterium]
MPDIIEQIRAAGVVGMGGAGFPTHAKLKAGIRHIIINGVECEPLLCADRYLMRHRADELIDALSILRRETGAEQATICLKSEYAEETAALREAISRKHTDIGVHLTRSFYPAGDEQVVVYEVTGKIVPPMDIPLSVGCAVINVATLFAVSDALADRPLISRCLTVDGEVKTPAIIEAPIGASFAECIAACGGTTRKDAVLVSGGPMMGRCYELDQAEELFTGKTTGGILVLPRDRYRSASIDLHSLKTRASVACIQCSYCTQMCPRYLLGHPLEPHRIMRKLAYGDLKDMLNDPVVQSAALCSECGLCEVYACPMGLKPRSVNAWIKREMAAANIRFPKPAERVQVNAMREMRLAPTLRVAVRAGVLAYEKAPLDRLIRLEPKKTVLALRQGIGASSVPLVSPGDRVRAGQRVAACPQGSLGADLHASIDGFVQKVDPTIVIMREDSL